MRQPCRGSPFETDGPDPEPVEAAAAEAARIAAIADTRPLSEREDFVASQASLAAALERRAAAHEAQGLARGDTTGKSGWSLRRAASRVAIGSFLGIVFQYMYGLANIDEIQNQDYSLVFGEIALYVTLAATIVVVFVEAALGGLRLPDGQVYGIVGAETAGSPARSWAR